MFKKFVTILMTGVLAVSAVACGGGSAPAETTAAPSVAVSSAAPAASKADESKPAESKAASPGGTSQEEKDQLGEVKAAKPYKLGLTIAWRDQFLSALESAVKEEADAQGCELTTVDANQNANTQISQIQTFVSQGCNAIIVVQVNTENAEQIMSAAGDIPVVFVNIVPVIDLTGRKATKVGSNERQAGEFQGQFLINYFKDKGKDPIKYVMMQGTLGLSHTTDRTNAARETLANSDLNFKQVYEDTAEFDRSKAQNKMQTYLGTKPEFDCVICNNDEMALGCIEAMKSAGYDPKKIPVVGIDATPAGLTAMEAGDLAMTVFQDAKGQGFGAIRAAIKMANGDEVPPRIYIPFVPVTPANMAEFK